MNLAEHLTIAASASMFYIETDYKNEPSMKVAATMQILKYISCFLNSGFLVSTWPLHIGKPQETWHELALE